MIGFLRGILMTKEDPSFLVLDVNGVGYEVMVSVNTFYQLPALNHTISLLIHMIVREDAQLLFGFSQEQERHLFRALIKVSGVGPKLALAILSGIEPQQFVHCVHQKDTARLTRIPGVGKKTAERLIIETRDMSMNWQYLSNGADCIVQDQTHQQSLEDAVSALTSLGYKPNEAKSTVQLFSDQTHQTETLVRLAIQKLVKGS